MNKYNLSKMNIGDRKFFDMSLYDKIRLACHFCGKRHNRKYSTKKLKKKIQVTRIS